jgi:hypothetical protein
MAAGQGTACSEQRGGGGVQANEMPRWWISSESGASQASAPSAGTPDPPVMNQGGKQQSQDINPSSGGVGVGIFGS